MNDRHLDDDSLASGGDAAGGDRAQPAGSSDAPRPEEVLERLIELAVYAPVGVAVTLRDELPRHIKQGRQALENRVQLARFIGQLAVQTGQRELQKRIEQQRAARDAARDQDDEAAGASVVGDASTASVDAVDAVDADDAGVVTDAPADAAPAVDAAAMGAQVADDTDRVPGADELPIADYESLPAINVVDRLRSMSADEIELVRRFEVAHRSRRTILAKIDQLQDRQSDGDA